MAVDRAMVDAGVAGEVAQRDRFHAGRLQPLKRRIDQRFRQIPMTKCIAFWLRFSCHCPVPTDFKGNLSPLDGKAKLSIYVSTGDNRRNGMSDVLPSQTRCDT